VLKTKTLGSPVIAEPELIVIVESEQAGGVKDCVDAKVRLPVDLRQHVLR
jgi:hypothetical protein